MTKMHFPQHNPDLPKEKGKWLFERDKKILHSVRVAVNEVYSLSEAGSLKTADIIKNIKQKVSDNLSKQFNEKIEKAITTALKLQTQQFERDFSFLLRAAQFLNQCNLEAISHTVDLFLSKGKYSWLDTSKSLRSMRIFISVLKLYMKPKELKKFLKDQMKTKEI